jgi:two-component system OmpR family response regulator
MRVLIVDDEIRLADGIKRGLEAEGFAVDMASNGVDGLWYATENTYDVILLDIMMPGMNGYAVCKALRDKENWTPVMMLTAKDGEWDQVDGLEIGADDYVVKPVHFAVLVARIRALARRGATKRPTVLTFGDLRIDPAARSVRRSETQISLTSREFAVLAFLARNVGVVVSKLQVLQGVWDDDFDGDPNIVEVYIAHLRNKIDRPFDKNAISTIRGAGYRLEVDGG